MHGPCPPLGPPLTICSLLFLPEFYFLLPSVMCSLLFPCRLGLPLVAQQVRFMASTMVCHRLFFCTTQFLSLFINLEILVHSSRLDNLISSWLCLCYMASNRVSCVNQYVSWYMCYFHHTVILLFRFNDPMGSSLQDGFFW